MENEKLPINSKVFFYRWLEYILKTMILQVPFPHIYTPT